MKKKIISIIVLTFLIIGSLGIVNGGRTEKKADYACECDNEFSSGQSIKSDISSQNNRELNPEEMAERCGVIDGGEYDPNVGTTFSGSVPSSFDWSDHNGHNWMTPVQDQGNCGSCWAFATIGVIEAKANIISNDPNLDLDLSEQFMVSCGTADTENSDMPDYCMDGCDGSVFDPKWFGQKNWLDWSVIYDAIDDDAFQYSSGDTGNAGSCKQTYSDDILVDVTNWGWVINSENDRNAIKNALLNKGPLLTSFKVYSDFPGNDDIYEYDGEGYKIGGHAVVIVGYNDDPGYWIVKNSWGEGWGPNNNGYFKIKYGETECEFERFVAYIDITFDTLPKKSFHGTHYSDADPDPSKNHYYYYHNYGNRILRISEGSWEDNTKIYYKFDISNDLNGIEKLDIGINYIDESLDFRGNGPTVYIKNYEENEWVNVWGGSTGKRSKYKWKWKNDFARSKNDAMDYVSNNDWILIKVHVDDIDDTFLNIVGVRYDEILPEPDLKVTGNINFNDVEPGSSKTETLLVKNVGEEGSKLNWEIDFDYFNHPDFVTDISPSSGSDLSDSSSGTDVNVYIDVPDAEYSTFTGKIKFVNSDDENDYTMIPVSISTPKTRTLENSNLIRSLNRFAFLGEFLFSLFQSQLDV